MTITLVRSLLLIPTIDELIYRITANIKKGKHLWLSSLDGTGSYNQVRVDPEFGKYLTFTLPFGSFQYLRMPQGLCTSPEAFQELIRNLFGHLPFVFIYIDDLLVFTWGTEEKHQEDIARAITICIDNNIRLN